MRRLLNYKERLHARHGMFRQLLFARLRSGAEVGLPRKKLLDEAKHVEYIARMSERTQRGGSSKYLACI